MLLRTLAGPARAELPKIQGSRFLGQAFPASDHATALAAVQAVRDALPDASHHCFAWRLPDGSTRAYDDGEPTGTAGQPILMRLDGADLHAVVLVVSRWFGGTKLGTGGLLRAYGGAASATLATATIITEPRCLPLDIRFAFHWQGQVQSVLRAYQLEPLTADYGADVSLHLQVPEEQHEALIADLIERTAGQLHVA